MNHGANRLVPGALAVLDRKRIEGLRMYASTVVEAEHRNGNGIMKPDVGSGVDAPDWKCAGSLEVRARVRRIRKQVYELALADLAEFPVWEFRLDAEDKEGQDESTVRPYTGPGPLDTADRMFVVRAIFTLADGSRLQGYCSPPLRGDDSIGALQPIIITDRGQVRFWCGTALPDAERLTRSYEWLGKPAGDVFPVQFESDVKLVSVPAKGVLPGFLVLEDARTRQTRTVV